MKRRRHAKNRAMRLIRLWTYADAVKAVPYFRSLTNALRDHWLELQSKVVEAKRLEDVRRPKRGQMIALEETQDDLRQAQDKFNDALEELMKMDVFLLDPVQGIALIPFQQADDLAWYVFDLFDEHGLASWRYHKDPLETRRPMLEERQSEPPTLVSAATPV